jgi:branched-chain amino acid transport system permease protein
MMGAFCAWFLLNKLGMGYWWSLALAPLAVGAFGMLIERTMLKQLYKLDHLYGLLLTFGLALILQGCSGRSSALPGSRTRCRRSFRAGRTSASCSCRTTARGSSSRRSSLPRDLVRDREDEARAYLRAATENPTLVQAFGINVPRMITLTYGFGVALAGLAGVMAAPIYQVSPLMGADLIIVVFAVVVIGGMGSILGAIVTGFALGIIEGLTKVFYPEASNTVIFIVMAIVLIIKPAGLFRDAEVAHEPGRAPPAHCACGHGDRVRACAGGDLPAVPDEGAVLRAVRLRVQPADRLRRAAVVRPRDVLRHRRLLAAHAAKVWGLRPEFAILLGTGGGRAARRRSPGCSRSGARASISR